MKLLLQSLLISIIVHFIYFAGSIISGIILTRRHVQDISVAYENVQYLQNEVVFGYAISPYFFIGTFLLVAAIAAIVITLLKKLSWKGTSND